MIEAAEGQHAGNGRMLEMAMGRTKGVEEVRDSRMTWIAAPINFFARDDEQATGGLCLCAQR